MRVRGALAVCTAFAVGSAVAATTVYDTHEKTTLPAAIAVRGDDVYVAWARLVRNLKIARFDLSEARRGEVYAQDSVALTWRTNESFALISGGDGLFLGWVDYRTAKVELARFKIKSTGKPERGDTRTTHVKPRGGLSLAYDDGRLYLGYTDNEEGIVKIVSYKVSRKGEFSRENERKLAECETVVGASIAVAEGKLVVAWVNSDKKFMLTTYDVEKSSKGSSFRHLKDTRTQIKVRTNPVMDKPSLSFSEEEVAFAYVDRNDKTAHVKFYTVDPDGGLRSGGEARVNERPTQPVCVASSGGKVYLVLADQNKDLLIAEQ